jgi:hypothetical protein
MQINPCATDCIILLILLDTACWLDFVYRVIQIFKKPLISSEASAAQGFAAKINDYKSLILKEKRTSHFSFFLR